MTLDEDRCRVGIEADGEERGRQFESVASEYAG